MDSDLSTLALSWVLHSVYVVNQMSAYIYAYIGKWYRLLKISNEPMSYSCNVISDKMQLSIAQ